MSVVCSYKNTCSPLTYLQVLNLNLIVVGRAIIPIIVFVDELTKHSFEESFLLWLRSVLLCISKGISNVFLQVDEVVCNVYNLTIKVEVCSVAQVRMYPAQRREDCKVCCTLLS